MLYGKVKRKKMFKRKPELTKKVLIFFVCEETNINYPKCMYCVKCFYAGH